MTTIIDYWINNPAVVGGTFILLICTNLFLLKRGEQLRQVEYVQRIKQRFYITDPIYRVTIEEKKPINARVWTQWITKTILVMILSFMLMNEATIGHPLVSLVAEMALGWIFLGLIASIANLLSGIYRFRFVNKNPAVLDGGLEISKSHVYEIHKLRHLGNALMWLVLFLVVTRVFFLGGCLKGLAQIQTISKWEKKEENRSTA